MHSSIKGYLSAIRRMQIVGGLGDPFTISLPLLEYTLRGVKLRQAKKQMTRPWTRLPMTPSLMKKLRSSWEKDSQSHNNIMLWAAYCMALFGFLRAGEITVPSLKEYDPDGHLSAGDVALDSQTDPTEVRVHIKESKTDPIRKGEYVYLGRTENELCPVAAISAFLVVRGMEAGPFFRFASRAPLSRDLLVRRVREALEPWGIDKKGHSFRIGAATAAAAAGVEDSLIKTLGKWESSTLCTYVRVPRDQLASISKRLSTA